MSYTVTLSDGTKLENLRVNGDIFISNYEVSEETFAGKLKSVLIESTDDYDPYSLVRIGHHNDMELVSIQHDEAYIEQGEYWFTLADIPESEIRITDLETGVDDSYDAIAELGGTVSDMGVTLDDVMDAIAELGQIVEG